MRISDWSSDVCSSDLPFGDVFPRPAVAIRIGEDLRGFIFPVLPPMLDHEALVVVAGDDEHVLEYDLAPRVLDHADDLVAARSFGFEHFVIGVPARRFLHVEADAVIARLDAHPSELPYLM